MSNGRSLYGHETPTADAGLNGASCGQECLHKEFGGMHGRILNGVFTEDFSEKTLRYNYGEVSAVSGRIIDEPGFMFLAVRDSLAEAMDSWLFGERKNAEPDNGKLPFSREEVLFDRNEESVEKRNNHKDFYTEFDSYNAGGSHMYSPDSVVHDEGESVGDFAESNPLKEFGMGLFSANPQNTEAEDDLQSVTGTADDVVLTHDYESSENECGDKDKFLHDGILSSCDVFEMFDFAEKADSMLKRHDRDNRMLWIESGAAAVSDGRGHSCDKILRYGVLRETLSRLMKNSEPGAFSEGSSGAMVRTGLDADVLPLITDCMRGDGLSDAVYRGLKFLHENAETGNGTADRTVKTDPFFPIKLDADISDSVSHEDIMDDGSLCVGNCSRYAKTATELLLRDLYRGVFRAGIIPPKYLREGTEAEFINGYVTDLVLGRIMFAALNAAERKNMSLKEYLKEQDLKVSIIEKMRNGKNARRFNSWRNPKVSSDTEKVSDSEALSEARKSLEVPGITESTGFLRLNAVCPENLTRLRLFDELVDAEIAGHKYDGAFFEMIENLAERNFPILWGIKLLLNSQKGDIKNKARCLKTNLGFFFDVRKFASVSRIRMPEMNFETPKRISNKKAMTQRQKQRFRQLTEVSLYVAAMVLCVFSETEILFNGRNTLKHLGRAAANIDAVKRNVRKGLKKYGGRNVFSEETEDERAIEHAGSLENAQAQADADACPVSGHSSVNDGSASQVSETDDFIRNKTYSVKFRVLDLEDLNEGVKGLALRITSSPRIELMYLAVLTILTIVEPEDEYMDILGREFDMSIPEIASGKKVLLLQWRFNEKKK